MHDAAPPDLLKNRVILVTGAGQGLGRAAAIAFARHGATVVLLGRGVGKLEKVYDKIVAADGAQPAIFPMDLGAATDADFEAMAQAIGWQIGRLDGILHCAATYEAPRPLSLDNLDDWLRMFRVNTAAPAAINRACTSLLEEAGDASVILVGESHGQAPAAYWGSFAVSKAALDAYFRIQADEWADRPVRINLVIPGPVNTPQRARSHPAEDKSVLPQPADVMPLFLQLMGPGGRDIRGQLIHFQP